MKKYSITFRLIFMVAVVVLAVTAAGTKTAFAHQLQSDGSVHVIMHINSDDNPVVGKKSTLVFYVFDDQENFSGKHCNCNVDITMDGTNLLSKPLNIGDNGFNHVGELPFSFPMLGDYQIIFSGKPIDGSSFQAFNLTFTANINNSGPPSNPDKPFFIGTAILGILMIGLVFFTIREFKDA